MDSVEPSEVEHQIVNGESAKLNEGKGPPDVDQVVEEETEDDTEDAEETENGDDPEYRVKADPATPTKLTPHKRTAQVAHGTSGGSSDNPPESPAPKKKKWEDYVADHDRKTEQQQERAKSVPPEQRKVVVVRELYGFLKNPRVWISAVVVLVVAALVMYFQIDFSNKTNLANKPRYTWKKAQINFLSGTKALRLEFPEQNNETWIQLVASIASTLAKTEPEHPAAITVLFPPTMDDKFPVCFLKKIGKIVNSAVAPLLNKSGNTADVKELRPLAFLKSPIDDIRSDLIEYFNHEGKVLLSLDLDKIESEDHLHFFHGLCESTHPLHRRATVFFPLRVSQDIFSQYEWTHARGGDIANELLSQIWKSKLSADSGPAMVARVADAVILLQEGDKCTP